MSKRSTSDKGAISVGPRDFVWWRRSKPQGLKPPHRFLRDVLGLERIFLGRPLRALGQISAAIALIALLGLGIAIAHAAISQKGDLRVSFGGKIAPFSLPRSGSAPVAVSVSGKISTTDGASPPQLQTIKIAINRTGHLFTAGLPICRLAQIQPATSANALAACRRSLVGEGSFSANVELPQQSPFPSNGRVLAFNGMLAGKPVILAHVYGTDPIPTSYTLPFSLSRAAGTFALVLSTNLPQVTSNWGFVTGLELRLDRRFSYRGKSRSYLSAGCPAPRGFSRVAYPFARATFAFAGNLSLTNTLTRSCRVSR